VSLSASCPDRCTYDTHFIGGWWDPEPVYMIWRGNKFHDTAGIRNLDRRACNLFNCKENLKIESYALQILSMFYAACVTTASSYYMTYQG